MVDQTRLIGWVNPNGFEPLQAVGTDC